MLRNLKFPILYLLEVLLLVPLLGGFVLTVAFLASKPVSSFDLGGKSLPADWAAAYLNHGRYLRGYLVNDHPAVFAALLAGLLATVVMIYQVHKAQSVQRMTAGSSRAHKIAQVCVLAVWMVFGYVLVMHCLVGVEPA